jgi:hypothetical protein
VSNITLERIYKIHNYVSCSTIEVQQAAARKGDACGSLIFSPGMSGATLTYDPTSAAGIKLVVQEGSSIVSIGT